jgi:uncharacterized protein (DUF1697 family)
MNPNMRNEKLRGVCEDLGFDNVQTVISSGNVVFETQSGQVSDLEAMLEGAWPMNLGFESTTIIRSQQQLLELVNSGPFADLEHGQESYLLVTFSKHPLEIDFDVPFRPADDDWSIIGATSRELFSVTDTTSATTPNVMSWLEGQLGKEITSRTWLTVERILKRMQS